MLEALAREGVTAIRVSPRADERLTEIVRLAEAQGVGYPACVARRSSIVRRTARAIEGVVADLAPPERASQRRGPRDRRERHARR